MAQAKTMKERIAALAVGKSLTLVGYETRSQIGTTLHKLSPMTFATKKAAAGLRVTRTA